MGQVTIRNGLISKGFLGLSPWGKVYNPYWYAQINLGSNFISRIEVVSSLNFFNIASHFYHYNIENCTEKYNPKVYLGAVQSVASIWNADVQTNQKNGLENLGQGDEKSGSM